MSNGIMKCCCMAHFILQDRATVIKLELSRLLGLLVEGKGVPIDVATTYCVSKYGLSPDAVGGTLDHFAENNNGHVAILAGRAHILDKHWCCDVAR